MSSGNRLPISKRLRFKVFERDKFKCSYCGRSVEDGAILHIDHIVPVSKGGTNEEVNLTTACNTCNLGKGARLVGGESAISIKDVNEKLKQEVLELNERAEQLKEYYKYKEKLLTTKEPEETAINKVLKKNLGYELSAQGYRSFKRLHEKCGVDIFIKGVNIVSQKSIDWDSFESKHKYLCGVLNNLYKEKTDPVYNKEREIKLYYLNHPHKRGSDYYTDWKIRPYIEVMDIAKIKELIDETFRERRSAYFSHLLELCNEYIVDTADFEELFGVGSS